MELRGKRSKREQRGKNNGGGNRCEGVVEARMGMYSTQGMGRGKGPEQKSRCKGEGGCMRDGGTRMIEMRH